MLKSQYKAFTIQTTSTVSMCRRLWLAAWMTVLVISFCKGQSSDFVYKQYTVSDHLPSNECYDVVQDMVGHIWVSTDNGVSRYDGYEFVTYDVDDGLVDPVIFNLYLDAGGVLWAGGLQGQLYYYDSVSDYWNIYEHQNLLDSLKTAAVPLSQYHFRHDTLYTVMYGAGFISISQAGAMTTHRPKADEGIFLNRRGGEALVYTSMQDEKTSSQIPIYIDTLRKSWRWDAAGESDLPTKGFNSTRSVCTVDRTFLYGNTSVQVYDQKMRPMQKVNVPVVQSVVETRDGSLVTCHAAEEGVRMYEDDLLQRYKTILRGVDASNFLEDSDGGYWITTIDQGLFYISNTNIKYLTEHQQDGYYTLLSQDYHGQIYTASYAGSLDQVDVETKYVDIIDYEIGDQYESIYYDSVHQRLLYSNAGKSISVDRNGDKTEIVVSRKYNGGAISTREFYFADEYMYALHASGYVEIFTSEDYKHLGTIEVGQRLNTLHIWNDSLIIATGKGLHIYADSTLIPLSDRNSLFGLRVDVFVEDDQGVLHMGTKGSGIITWVDGQEPDLLTTDHGLLSNSIEDLCLGDSGYIWVATLRGINRIRIESAGTVEIRKYTKSHGLPIEDVYDLEWYDGKLYAATGSGVIVVEEEDLNENPRIPKIQQITANGEQLSLGDVITLSHDQNDVVVRYSVIDYDHGSNVRYRLSINNGEARIIEDRQVYLTDMRSGRYKIEIEAENKDGFWSPPATAVIVIKKAWYKTWWVYSLVILLLSGSIVYHFLRREARLKQEHAVKEEMRSLERAALSSQMNPHFIFNSLNSIQNYIMGNDKLMAMDYLSRFAKLIRLTLRASTQRSVSLHDEVRILEYYLGLEKLRFKNKFDWSISLADNLNGAEVALPPMLVQPLVENAIKHGMKDKKEGGRVEVRFADRGAYLCVTVRDNGPGFSEDMMEGFADDAHQSLGMRITSDRIGRDGLLTVARNGQWTEVTIEVKQ